MKKKLSIELTENSIGFILSGHSKNGISIEGFYREHTPDAAEDKITACVQRIKEIIESNGWSKYKKNLLYRLDDLEHVVLEIPNVPEEEMESIIRKKLENQKLIDDEDKIAYGAIGDFNSKGLQSVYVQVIHSGFLEKFSDLKLHGIDFEPFAVNRAMGRYANKKENSFFIDIQETQTIAAIYFKDTLTLYRKINIGRKDFVRSLAEMLSIEENEAEEKLKEYGYVDNIKAEDLMENGVSIGPQLNMACEAVVVKLLRKTVQYLDYFQFKHSGEAVNTIYFSGGSIKTEDIESSLERDLYIKKIYNYKAYSGIKENPVTMEFLENNHWNVLIGTVHSEEGIYRVKGKLKLPFKLNRNPIYIVFAIIFIMFCSIKYGFYKIQEMEQIKKINTIEEKKKEIVDYIKEADILESHIQKTKKDLMHLSKITGKNTIFNNFLYEVSEIIPSEIYFEDIKYVGNTVFLRGKAVSHDEYAEVYINELLRNIEKISKSARLVNTVKSQRSTNINDFMVEVELYGGEKNEEK